MGSKKDIDSTLTEIAKRFQDEFYLKTPPFIILLKSKTQCFHYYGREYFKEYIRSNNVDLKRLTEALNKAKEVINSDKEIKRWYEEVSNENTKAFLNNSLPKNANGDKNNLIDIFVDLLLNTPISRHYGVTGQTFHTRVPRFFYNEGQFNKYSGAEEYIENDLILANKQISFTSIINTLEGFFWEGLKIKSAIMSHIPLYGQIAGIAFVAETEEKFTPYDYLRFLQLVKELGITSIKDAKEFEFLSVVLQDLPSNGFDVLKTVFIRLPILFNITGACMREKDNIFRRLSFDKQDGSKLFPEWKEISCVICNNFSYGNASIKIISLGEICNIHNTDKYLKPKSGLYIKKEDIAFILYFDFEENILEMYSKGIELAIDDVLGLIKITEKNIQFHKGYGHDTTRLMSDISIENIDFIKGVIDRRTKLMVKLFGEKITDDKDPLTDVHLKDEIIQIWKIFNDVYRKNRQKDNIELPKMDIPPERYIYLPAVECILYNLIKNTFQNYEDANIQYTDISFIANKLTYIQKGKNFKFGFSEGQRKVTPKDIHRYLNGEDINWTKLTGLGHYIIQWIMDRFRDDLSDLSIVFREKNKEITVKKDMYEEKDLKNSESSVTYEIKFPLMWR